MALTFMIFDHIKGNNSSTTNASLTKFYVHHIVIVIHIKYKFHEIPFSGYFVMALDIQMDGKTKRQKEGLTD